MRAARAGAAAARQALARAGARAGPSPASPWVASLLPRTTPGLNETRWYATWAVSAGNGDHGRLGHGPSGSGDHALGLSSARFGVVRLPVDAVAASAGGAHTVLVGADGAVYTCGLNDFGQLGHSFGAATTSCAVPRKVEGLPEHDPVVAAAAGHFHTLCLTRGGEVWAFGRNDRAQCGLGAGAGPAAPTPRWLASLSPDAPGGDDRGPVAAVAAGPRHSIAVTANGAVFSWGADFEGCLGHGGHEPSRSHGGDESRSFWRSAADSLARFASRSHRDASSPRLLRALADAGVKAVSPSCGDAHSLVLDADGTVHAFGQGRFNQLGVGAERDVAWLETPTPVAIPPELLLGGGVARASAGGNFNVAVTRDGGLISWGANGNGECGGGAEDDGRRDSPRAVRRPSDPRTNRPVSFASAAAGWRHAAATTRDGRLYAWGWGGSAGQHWEDAFTTGGQLGVGDGQVDFWEPTRVPGIGSGNGAPRATSVSCGFNHTAAIVSDDADA